jgi:membrane protein YdbS with pleckstrin-like domain
MVPSVSSESEPAQVVRYLLPNETCVAMVRRHPAVLIAPSAQAIAGLLVAFVLTATLLRNHSLLIWIVWGLWALLLLRLVWEAVNWAVDYFVITSKRILLTSGLFTRNVAMMPLSKVTDMSFRRSFTGRMLGYGDFVIESAGQDQALRMIDHIPYPEDLYRRVCGRIFDAPVDEDERAYDADLQENLGPLLGPEEGEPILLGPDDSDD